MKKTIFAAALLFASVAAFAQKQGDLFVEGSIDLSCGTQKNTVVTGSSSSSEKGSLGTEFGINLGAGYFVIDNVKVGLDLGFDYMKSGSSKLPAFSINPNVAYYLELAKNFYYTPELGFAAAFGTDSTTYTLGSMSTTTKYGYSAFGAYLNLLSCEYRINSNFAIGVNVGSLSLLSTKLKDKENTDNYTKNTSFGLDLGSADVCLRFYF